MHHAYTLYNTNRSLVLDTSWSLEGVALQQQSVAMCITQADLALIHFRVYGGTDQWSVSLWDGEAAGEGDGV